MATLPASRKRRQPKTAEHYKEALVRAHNGHSAANTMIVYHAMRAAGYTDVRPYENVLTFDAWRGLGRTVRRGEHGTRITVYVPMEIERVDANGQKKIETLTRPRSALVFHESQTELWQIGGGA